MNKGGVYIISSATYYGEKQRGQSSNQPSSGLKYHEEYAGKVTGVTDNLI